MAANAGSALFPTVGRNNDEAPFPLKMYQLFVVNGDGQDDCTSHSDAISCWGVCKNKPCKPFHRHLGDSVKNVNTTEDREGQLVFPYD